MDKRQFTVLCLLLLLVAGAIAYATVSANERAANEIHYKQWRDVFIK